MIEISIVLNDKTLNTYTFDKTEIIIGRNDECDIHIDNLAVSGRHARIVREEDVYWIEDLESTNGTFIDEIMIKRMLLQDNQKIIVGKHLLVINFEDDGTIGVQDRKMKTMILNTKNHKKMLKKQ